MNERMTAFKPIPMLNNLYEISEDGEKFYYVGTGIIRKLDKNDSGYTTVTLDNKQLG